VKMPVGAATTLQDVDHRGINLLVIDCAKCSRRGNYWVANLIQVHGKRYRLTDLLSSVSEDCPKRIEAKFADQCGAMFEGL
jgi:hypothetical protein